jgi:pseudaminic acid cytidylyltransferase
MRRVAIVTARGGSKRLPRKNIKVFHGRPIIHYPIAAARASGLFDEVFVSTEDPEIMAIAEEGGAVVLHRPLELASDTATTAAVMRHAVNHLVSNGAPIEFACCIYPCTPCILPTDFHDGLALLHGRNAQYVFPVTTYEQAPQRMLNMRESGVMCSVWPEYDHVRNQDLPTRFHDGGQWYWGRASAWCNEVPIYQTGVGMVLPRWRCIDIDTIDDWEIAEAVYQAKVINARGP